MKSLFEDSNSPLKILIKYNKIFRKFWKYEQKVLENLINFGEI